MIFKINIEINMETERTRRRNRNRHLRKKEQKMSNSRYGFTINRNTFIICTLIAIVTFLIGKVEIENICLYNKGEKAKAYVYKLRSTKNVSRSVYEFKVSNERYTGEDLNSKLGDSIQVVYLPKNPKINRNADVLDKDWCIWLYRKIFE